MRSVSNVVMAFLATLARSFLKGLWDSVWEKIFEAVVHAEHIWRESGQGQAKKNWAMKTVMEHIESKTKLSWLQRRIVEMLVSTFIDGLIATVNDEFGHSWIDHVKGIEQDLAKKWSIG